MTIKMKIKSQVPRRCPARPASAVGARFPTGTLPRLCLSIAAAIIPNQNVNVNENQKPGSPPPPSPSCPPPLVPGFQPAPRPGSAFQ